jgi:hypothetical protein
MDGPGTSVAIVAAMTRTRLYVLCVFLATLPGTGCAGRQRVSSVPSVSSHSKSDRADAGTSTEMRKAIGALRESLREKKPAPAAQPPQQSVSDSPPQHSDEQGVGTSGKWVVTTATQRPNQAVASMATRTVKPPDARPREGMPLRMVGAVLIAGLLLILAAVVAAGRRVPERR